MPVTATAFGEAPPRPDHELRILRLSGIAVPLCGGAPQLKAHQGDVPFLISRRRCGVLSTLRCGRARGNTEKIAS